jgi:hypothetical protein
MTSIFISYNWAQNEFADKLVNEISPYVEVIRDKDSLEIWGNLTSFMKCISSENFAVLLISDEYLKSINCMYEVSQLMKDDNWNKKVFYVVFDNAKKIYKVVSHGKYSTYWDKKRKVLESKIVPPFQCRLGEVEELQKIHDILNHIGAFLKEIRESKNPKSEDEAIAEVLKRIKINPDDDGIDIRNSRIKEKPGIAAITYTYVPPIGSYKNLKGMVLHVKPSDYQIVVYIKVAGLWWIKPYATSPTTPINKDGTWHCNITTGGNDSEATEVVSYLIPKTYIPQIILGKSKLPQELDKNAVANITITRH